MFAIIRIRGAIKTNVKIEDTMKLLNLTRNNHCVIYPDNRFVKGMLHKLRNMVTYGEISNETLKKMLNKRGFCYNEKGKLIKFKEHYKDEKKIDKLVEEILSGKTKLEDIGVKKVFRLKPPTKGFDRKGIKKTFKEGGVLGYRADHINKLLIKMI